MMNSPAPAQITPAELRAAADTYDESCRGVTNTGQRIRAAAALIEYLMQGAEGDHRRIMALETEIATLKGATGRGAPLHAVPEA